MDTTEDKNSKNLKVTNNTKTQELKNTSDIAEVNSFTKLLVEKKKKNSRKQKEQTEKEKKHQNEHEIDDDIRKEKKKIVPV